MINYDYICLYYTLYMFNSRTRINERYWECLCMSHVLICFEHPTIPNSCTIQPSGPWGYQVEAGHWFWSFQDTRLANLMEEKGAAPNLMFWRPCSLFFKEKQNNIRNTIRTKLRLRAHQKCMGLVKIPEKITVSLLEHHPNSNWCLVSIDSSVLCP